MRIDVAAEADIEEIAQMLGEIEEYYGGENVPGDREQVRGALLGPSPAATVLLARDDEGQVLGLASYSRLWPAAGADTSLYLKELFVREPFRKSGVGRRLMEAVQAAGVAEGCTRLEWTADTDNPAAVDFYAALGAHQNAGKVMYRAELPR
ncbi:GNAT family N-acetyltransferase [Streptomyces sp. NPDC005395]|uniref:GNAT family N-acetyltransferase n=1 Tax=Streptomyces sp. NPDC005395 TaxID=3157042 RepID=UPI0033B88E4D